MTNPNTVTFIGNIDIFEEKTDRTPPEIALDDIPEQDIVLQDLTFKLKKSPSDYYRPGAIYGPNKLIVVSNPLFFRAAKQAGLKEMLFDFIPSNNNAGESLMEKYNLRYAQEPIMHSFNQRFLFFHDSPQLIETGDLDIRQPPQNTSQDYLENNCQQYIIPILNRNEGKLIKRAIETNGRLRSIDGIKDIEMYKEAFA